MFDPYSHIREPPKAEKDLEKKEPSPWDKKEMERFDVDPKSSDAVEDLADHKRILKDVV